MCWPTRTTSRNDGNGFRPRAWWCWTGADDHRLGMGRRRGQGPGSCTASQGLLSSLRRPSPLRSSRDLAERYAQSSWPESHPVWCHAGHTVICVRPVCPNTPRFADGTEALSRCPGGREPVPRPDPGPELGRTGPGRGTRGPDEGSVPGRGTGGGAWLRCRRAPPPDSALRTPSGRRSGPGSWSAHPHTPAGGPVSARAGRGPRARLPDAPSEAGAWRSPRRSRRRRREPRPCARGARRRSRWGGRRK